MTAETDAFLSLSGVQDRVFSHLDQWCLPGPVAVAVSGGGDSVALLHLAAAWAGARGRSLHVLTVDHGLRAEAGEEAAFVAALAGRLGQACTRLSLSGLRPVQAETRLARQRVLAKAARGAGAWTLLTGHTLDDQLETFLMRLRQGSGVFGLGGIDTAAPSPVWPEGRDLRLVRPLLEVSRAELRDVLSAMGETWCEDPSNEDLSYERVRMRRLLAGDAGLRARISRLQAGFAVLRRADQRGLAAAISTRIEAFPDGSLLVDLTELARPRAERLLSLVLQWAAGHARPPRRAHLGPVLDGIEHAGERFTCAGAWLQVEGGGQLRLARDPGLCVPGWQEGVWDGRFVCAGTVPAEPAHRMAARSLPETGEGWRALAPGRRAQICDIWRQM